MLFELFEHSREEQDGVATKGEVNRNRKVEAHFEESMLGRMLVGVRFSP